MNQLITDNIDIWTSTVKTKSASGRGSSKKRELYGVKKLRELILELAVRGKLVPQDSNDEPASVLLERIAEEKAQLVKEKKIKKSKALPVVSKEEQSFVLPKGWTWERIGTFGVVGTGATPSRSKPEYWEPAEFNWVSSGETSELFVSATKERISGLAIKETNVSIYPKGTLIVAMYGQGKTRGQITELLESAGTNQACAAIQLVELSQDHKNYVKLFFRKAYLDLRSQAAGGAQPNLNVGKISNTVIPVPPLLEQHRIVAKVDELMTLCDQLEQQTEASIEAHQVLVTTLLDTLTNSVNAEELMQNWQLVAEHFDTLFTTEESIDQLKQTILQLAVMGKLVPQDRNDEPAAKLLERIAEEKAQLIKEKKIKKQKALPPISDDEKPFELPNGWEWCKFEHISKNEKNALKAGPFGSALKKSMYVDYGYKIYGQEQVIAGDENIGDYFVNEEKYLSLESCKVQSGDILISLVGTIGKVLIVSPNAKPGIINPRLVKISLFNDICRAYIRIVLGSKLIQDELFDSSHGSTMNVLNLGLLKKLTLPLPPSDEQEIIVSKVKSILLLCDQLKARLKESQITQLHLTDAIVEQAV
ncbi:restriction endonuclease subunit S [Vibrio splendidus]|nr:restriction endonuclease subunit S [Vibrio splendidus]